ncbi:MAG TPA: cupin domain-containing protein [Thermoanaerobaculia bacterium]|nr:cupin domain-containing protein [Thermoanaerobaculia bacterium]
MSIALSPADWLARLPGNRGERFVLAFEHGTLSVELYAPRGTDPQQPHARDEVYVVVSGSGTFVHGASRAPFAAGDLLFVAAGVPHRFEDFSDDLVVWVLFHGPEGGELHGSTVSASLRPRSAFEHGTLRVKLSEPRGVNRQEPHAQDEVYVVTRGSGTLVHGEQRSAFRAGDLMFVEAGLHHHFDDFSGDLAVWVVFFGPDQSTLSA